MCEDIEEQEEGNNQPLPDYLARSRAAAATELQRDEMAAIRENLVEERLEITSSQWVRCMDLGLNI